jgi:hypothetical protein
MRRTLWAVLALAMSACSDATTPPSSTVLPASEVSDVGVAEADEVEQAVSALTTPAAAGVAAPTAPSTCATVDDATDSIHGDHGGAARVGRFVQYRSGDRARRDPRHSRRGQLHPNGLDGLRDGPDEDLRPRE